MKSSPSWTIIKANYNSRLKYHNNDGCILTQFFIYLWFVYWRFGWHHYLVSLIPKLFEWIIWIFWISFLLLALKLFMITQCSWKLSCFKCSVSCVFVFAICSDLRWVGSVDVVGVVSKIWSMCLFNPNLLASCLLIVKLLSTVIKPHQHSADETDKLSLTVYNLKLLVIEVFEDLKPGFQRPSVING